MSNTDKELDSSNKRICEVLDTFDEFDHDFVSQILLSQLRTFVEIVTVKIKGYSDYEHDLFESEARYFVVSQANLRFLSDFHKLLHSSVSLYAPIENASERLMLKYYEYLLQIKILLKDNYCLEVLENLNKFPVSTDPALAKYYEKIVDEILAPPESRLLSHYNDRYYIRKQKSFFVDNKIFYEVTFTTAIDNSSKFDRVIAFTHLNILSNYAVKLSVSTTEIDIGGRVMPIQIIDEWEASIRPCELNNFSEIFERSSFPKFSPRAAEYRNLMTFLRTTGLNLVDVIDFPDRYYNRFKEVIKQGATANHFLNILDRCRDLTIRQAEGSNVIRYLLFRLNNKIIKLQKNGAPCNRLSKLYLKFPCIPFDDMPLVSSLFGHNPLASDLFYCIDTEGRQHELLARRLTNNTQRKGCLYTPVSEVRDFEDFTALIQEFNSKIYHGHRPNREIRSLNNFLYIQEFEGSTQKIIQKLKNLTESGVKNFSNSMASWLKEATEVDCTFKGKVLQNMFEKSHVALVYGAAGTGKTRLIEHISHFFKDNNKLYLANTNPAVQNLKSRISTGNTEFKTIASFLGSSVQGFIPDVLIIDECSTVNNADMLKVLNKFPYRLVILVGDIYQIESINFGNWFNAAKAFIPKKSVFELTKPYRTDEEGLLSLWDSVRNLDDSILKLFTENNYSTNIDNSIFERTNEDEIILCLNYDGLYGINNINKFLQGNNDNESIAWGIHTYKVGDPILFNDSDRFRPLFHNNLKGQIKAIKPLSDRIRFDIEIEKSVNELEISGFDDLELLDEVKEGHSLIRFHVNVLESTDEDDDFSRSVVPFQVSYAVSIHKSQGLEYSSVKIVITDEVEEMVTHNIFYTAITRAKNHLKVYWTPETEKKILGNLKAKFKNHDVPLLQQKFGF